MDQRKIFATIFLIFAALVVVLAYKPEGYSMLAYFLIINLLTCLSELFTCTRSPSKSLFAVAV